MRNVIENRHEVVKLFMALKNSSIIQKCRATCCDKVRDRPSINATTHHIFHETDLGAIKHSPRLGAYNSRFG